MVHSLLRYALVLVLLSLVQFARADRESDSLALVDLYEATDGIAWFSSWDLNASMDSWTGVTLNDSGSVVALNLENRNIIGKLPNLDLPELTQLVMSRNNLREEMPSLSNLANLQFLDLSENRISGPVPDFDLPLLKTLRLSGNNFSDALPNFSGMPELETLTIEDNLLSGDLPNFTALQNLRALRLANNMMSGPLPNLNFAPNLVVIDLSNNEFFGGVPIFPASTTLFEIRLSNNKLTGFVPRFTRTPLLDVLLLDNNRLVGTVPTLGRLDFIRELNFSNNDIEGDISFLETYPTLVEVDLSGNIFSGEISNFDGFLDLESLNLSDNAFTDTVPDLSALPSLEDLNLAGNQIKAIFTDVSTMPNLTTLDVSDNRLTFDPLLRLNAIDLPSFTYAPQKQIPLADTIYASIQDDVIIDLMVDRGTPNNIYSWMFNGIFLVATASNELLLPRIDGLDVGPYFCTVTNNFLPALSIRSEEVFLVMDCPFNEVFITDTICTGDTIVVNNQKYFTPGIYRDTVTVVNPAICDSIYIIELDVNETFDTTITDTICASEGYLLGDTLIRDSGRFVKVFAAQSGCDSVVTLNLTVHPSYTQVGSAELCLGDTLFVGPFFHTAPGIYFDTLQTQNGCDSILITDLSVRDTFLQLTTIRACPGDTILYRGTTYTASARVVESFSNTLGCDSTYVLDLLIPNSTTYAQTRTICAGDSLVVGDTFYREAGVYLDSLTSSLGCDSIVATDLRVVDGFEEDIDLTICQGDTVFFGTDTITAAGIYIDSLTARGGCDSIVKLRLNVVLFIPRSIDTLLCHDEVLQVGPFRYDESGIFRDTLESPGNVCDTIVVSRVSKLDPITISDLELRLDIESDSGYINPTLTGGSGLYRYLWNTGASTLRLDGVPSGMYQLTVFDEEGCDEAFEFILDQSTSVGEVIDEPIHIYPNPVRPNQMLNIDLDVPSQASFVLLDMVGRSQDITPIESPLGIRIPVPSQPGVYVLRVQNKTQGQVVSRPIVVMH